MPPAPHQGFLIKLVLRLLSWVKPSAVRKSSRKKGFVLPIAILIVLVLSLVTVGLLTRSTQRNVQTQVERAGQIVDRQLDAVVDRARAKIDRVLVDNRLPRNSPSDDLISAAFLNDDAILGAGSALTPDPYDLPGETKYPITSSINVSNPDFTGNPGDGVDAGGNDEFLPIPVRAPAWWYLVDTDNDGTNDAVTSYTIITTREAAGDRFEANTLDDTERARRLVIRSGPLQGSSLAGCVDDPANIAQRPETGDWFQVGSNLFKPFQVFAVTVPLAESDSSNRATSALQFQQDRQRSLLNKWGYFGRSDVEFFFTPPYNWNGAIYAGGSLFFRYTDPGMRAYLISSDGSCFYLPKENSEITAFGEFVAGAIGNLGEVASGNVTFDGHPDERTVPTQFSTLSLTSQDSINDSVDPERVALDPLALHLRGQIRERGTYTVETTDWDASPINVNNTTAGNQGRVTANQFGSSDEQICPPYVDDVYRADDRFGPKPSYDRPPVTPDLTTGCDVTLITAAAGTDIPANSENNEQEDILGNTPPPGDLSLVGLDGYWERRARREGLRVIVGQRLELTRSDSLPLPLVPTAGTFDPRNLQPTYLTNEARQRMTLRDNPAAIQSTAIYHYSKDGSADLTDGTGGFFPTACLATVVHPGSADSLARSATFPAGDLSDGSAGLGINFFTGEGTNVWEYDPTPLQDNLELGTVTTDPLWVALRNLAYFAGDPNGAFPPTQQNGRIHPDPFITSFGDFSELRRVIDIVDGGTTYANLSLADQTTLQTAACTLGMLADNIVRIQDFAAAGDLEAIALSADINASRQGVINDTTRRIYLPLRYIFPDNFNGTDGEALTDLDTGSARDGAYPLVDEGLDYREVTDADLPNLALSPRAGIGNWSLPNEDIGNCAALPGAPNSSEFELIDVDGDCFRVPFKDSAFYDGREVMAVRALNVDLSLLVDRAGSNVNDRVNGDTWLPDGSVNGVQEGGIFYAFREDAVREDAIARPPLSTYAAYLTSWEANLRGDLGNTGIMNAGQPGRGTAGSSQTVWDPPEEPTTGLSGKPVDYYADPDRRPYGFRLRQGAILQRDDSAGNGFDANLSVYGMSFITDNPVYIQGDFNLHQDDANNLLEEFGYTLTDGANPVFDSNDFFTTGSFYSANRPASNLDEDFSRAASDTWRPTDVLGDSVNILSDNFCDGSVDDGFVQDGTVNGGGSRFDDDQVATGTPNRASAPQRDDDYGCTGGLGNTSFINQALVIRGTNWPSTNPTNNGSGLLAFAANGSQNLGNNLTQPGHPDVYSRDTIVSGGRDVRPPDADYVSFPPRVSSLGNPVFDTTRWLQVAPQECPTPNGGGPLGEYYNGWLDNPTLSYNPDTGFASLPATDFSVDPRFPGADNGPSTNPVPTTNLGYLRGVRTIDNNGTGNGSTRTIFDFPFNAGSGDEPFNNNDGGGTNFNGYYGLNLCLPDPGATSDYDDRFFGNNRATPNPGDITRFVNSMISIDLSNTDGDGNEWPREDGGDDVPRWFERSCWRNLSGGVGIGNDDGDHFWVARYVAQLFPIYPGARDYEIDVPNNTPFRLVVRDNPDFTGTPPNPLGAPQILDRWSGSTGDSIELNLSCSPSLDESPYLMELQYVQVDDNSPDLEFFAERPDGSLGGVPGDDFYSLEYLKPVYPRNRPCLPDPTSSLPLAPNQEYCQESTAGCTRNFTGYSPGCDGCDATVLQTRQYVEDCSGTITPLTVADIVADFGPLPAQDPDGDGNQLTRTQPCSNFGASSNQPGGWSPTCQPSDAGTDIIQTRTVTQEFVCSATPDVPLTCPPGVPASVGGVQCRREISCNDVCNEVLDPPTQTCADDPVGLGGTTITETLGCVRNCNVGSPAEQLGLPCVDSDVNFSETCNPVCNPGPPGPWDTDCATVNPTCETQVTVTRSRTIPLDAGTSSPTGCTNPFDTESEPLICTGGPCNNQNFLPPALRPDSPFKVEDPNLRAAAPSSDSSAVKQVAFRWPKLGKLVGSAVDWIIGEPAYGAPQGVAAGLRPEIAQPDTNPGIRPALDIGDDSSIGSLPTPDTSDAWAETVREVFMECPTGLSDENGFWVPGVFRPNFNTHFEYTAYNGDSVPSTLRYFDADGSLDYTAGEVIGDRDPLFGFDPDNDAFADPGDVPPLLMQLNPYGRVTNANAQAYPGSYIDGYFIDDQAPSIRNGLCFYVRVDSGQVQIKIDNNGGNNGGQTWTSVEALTRDINSAPSGTGYSGSNPVLGVILDERTRRPIPLVSFDSLVPASVLADARKRNGDGTENNQLIEASATRVNTIAISGIVPPRVYQPSGGIPNFLRFNENWEDVDLFFSGSMIQLNYSTYATGPLFQQSFEPPNLDTSVTGSTTTGYDFYFPPNRLWGYDVGLQIARVTGPVPSRFEFPSRTRTEFYRDLEPSDPYIERLRCALQDQENPGTTFDLTDSAELDDAAVCDAFAAD